EPVHIVQDEHVERRCGDSFFQVSAYVHVVVTVAVVRQPVDQRRIGGIREDHRLVRPGQGVVFWGGHSAAVLGLRLPGGEVDHVHHAYPQVRQVLAEDVGRGQNLDGWHVARGG